MRRTITLPKLGDAVNEVVVIAVMVQVGDAVSEGQGLALVETDKVEVEVPAPVSGTVVAVHVAEEDSITTGAAIVELEI